jgi:carbonic anhydrase/acetyltransferase-like protein (isoleucine patch superfamily)
MRIRPKLFFIVGIMPRCQLKNFLLRKLGWKIAKRVSIGCSIFWNVGEIQLAKGSRIGSLNVFRDVNDVFFDSDSTLGNLNWISASPVLGNLGLTSSIKLGKRSVVTNRHYFDVSGGFSVGAGSAVTGVRSTVITHGVNPMTNAQELRKVEIGRHSLIGSNAVIVPGANVGDFQVFGMGSLISGVYDNPFELQLSKKSVLSKSIPSSSKFFDSIDE